MIVLDVKEFKKLGGFTAMLVRDLQNPQIIPQIADGIKDVAESLEGSIGEYRKDSRRARRRARRIARKNERMRLKDIFLGNGEKRASYEPAENKDFKTRMKSGSVGALNYFPSFAGLGAIAPVLSSIVEHGKLKGSLKKSLQGAVIMGGAGAIIGGARGLLYPGGRKILKIENGKLTLARLAPGE